MVPINFTVKQNQSPEIQVTAYITEPTYKSWIPHILLYDMRSDLVDFAHKDQQQSYVSKAYQI